MLHNIYLEVYCKKKHFFSVFFAIDVGNMKKK